MGFITAEALYPGVYTTHHNTVSHLGASEPPDSVVLQPSAAIFDITMLVGRGHDPRRGLVRVPGPAAQVGPASRPPCWVPARSGSGSSR